jgi:hypothetical protein
VLALALASESKLASSGAWIKWRRVLVRGLEAARLAADRSSEAHMLHQLGSLALCLGAVDEAAVQLAEALHIREGLGDEMGAELTRHNLRQIRGAPTPEAHGPDRPAGPPAKKRQWPFPKMTLLILALVIVLVLVVVLIALSGGGSRSASTVRALPTPNVTAPNQIQTATVASPTTETSTSTSTSTTTVVVPAPTVTISSPKDRSRVAQGSSLNAEFSCTPSGASCDATDANGQPVALGQPLDTETPGLHTLTVTASAQGVQPATRSATYSVFTTGTQDGTTPTPVNPGLLPTVPSTPPPPSPVG